MRHEAKLDHLAATVWRVEHLPCVRRAAMVATRANEPARACAARHRKPPSPIPSLMLGDDAVDKNCFQTPGDGSRFCSSSASARRLRDDLRHQDRGRRYDASSCARRVIEERLLLCQGDFKMIPGWTARIRREANDWSRRRAVIADRDGEGRSSGGRSTSLVAGAILGYTGVA